jgi:hypothetical protein
MDYFIIYEGTTPPPKENKVKLTEWISKAKLILKVIVWGGDEHPLAANQCQLVVPVDEETYDATKD